MSEAGKAMNDSPRVSIGARQQKQSPNKRIRRRSHSFLLLDSINPALPPRVWLGTCKALVSRASRYR